MTFLILTCKVNADEYPLSATARERTPVSVLQTETTSALATGITTTWTTSALRTPAAGASEALVTPIPSAAQAAETMILMDLAALAVSARPGTRALLAELEAATHTAPVA